jgi:hypothetical protein
MTRMPSHRRPHVALQRTRCRNCCVLMLGHWRNAPTVLTIIFVHSCSADEILVVECLPVGGRRGRIVDPREGRTNLPGSACLRTSEASYVPHVSVPVFGLWRATSLWSCAGTIVAGGSCTRSSLDPACYVQGCPEHVTSEPLMPISGLHRRFLALWMFLPLNRKQAARGRSERCPDCCWTPSVNGREWIAEWQLTDRSYKVLSLILSLYALNAHYNYMSPQLCTTEM